MAGLTLEQAQFYETQALAMGVPAEWIVDFLASNPGDYHRILDAYAGEAGGSNPTARAIEAAGGLNYLETLVPVPSTSAPLVLGGGSGGQAPSSGGLFAGGLSLTSILVLGAAGLAAWWLLFRRKG